MQLHRLALGAIGPFAEPCEIDVERLGASGLFLLEGPTGAGKSTLIDAIVFALYGQVAGQASSADRMHSDVADAEATPFVELDFSTTNGTYRIRRTPKHQRVKRRGAGMTTENASARLWRLASPSDSPGVDASDLGDPIANRLEEVGAEITRIIGLTHEQFVQTVVLPQGEFAAFLRSAPEGRRELLQRLFGTEIYDAVLDQLVENRKAAKKSLADAESVLAGAIRAYCGAAGLDDQAERTLTDAAAPDQVSAITGQIATLRAEVESAEKVTTAADVAAQEARASLAHQQAREQARLRLVRLRDELASLDAGADQLDSDRARLRRSEEALRLAPLLEGLTDAERRRDEAVAALTRQRAGLSDPDAASATWSQRERSLRDRAAELVGLRDLEQTLPDRTSALAALVRERDEVERRRRASDEAGVLAPPRIAELRHQLAAALTLQGGLTGAVDEQRSAAAALAAATELESLQEKLTAVRATCEAARQLAQQRRAEETQTRQRFLDSMAGNLASSLVVGEPCLVCGSRDHPRPAARRPGDANQEAVDAAANRLAQATAELEVAAGEVSSLELALSELRGRTDGVAVADAQLRVVNADLAVADLEIATQDASRLQTDIESQETALVEHRAASEALARAATRLQTEVAAAEAELERDRQRITAALEGHPSVGARIAALLQSADGWRSAAQAVHAVEAAKVDLATRTDEWNAALASSGFTGRDGVSAARLGDDERLRLGAAIEAHTLRRAEIGAALASPELSGIGADEVIDLSTAQATVIECETRQREVQERLARLRQRLDDSIARASDIEQALASRNEIEAGIAPIVRMADLASGSTPDNAKAMSLPTFVLRERFADVVASANDRLAAMSEGRYALAHVEDREGNKRSGLGLRIHDSHTEQPRDPGTLSGGETFYCSLALALGLADVVTAEAGGVDLGTLFVDEGFGALDPDTLDNVLSVLSGLGTSGRVVGIVSHVPELKERISERITVVPGRDGSSRVVVSA
jgi:exonuclease SbcC